MLDVRTAMRRATAFNADSVAVRSGGRELSCRVAWERGLRLAVPVTFMSPHEWFRDLPGADPVASAGRVMPFAELEIRGPDNMSVRTGEQGEIAICCEGQTTGIWDDPDLTARRLVEGAELDERTVVAACQEHLGSYKRPSRVVFRREPFPRSPVGKLQRKVVREPYWQAHARRVAA